MVRECYICMRKLIFSYFIMSSLKRKLITTADGSHTIYVSEWDEHYHSVNGAIQESMHVYIDAGLNQCSLPSISILEIGFGTGLNALLSYIEAGKRGINVQYTGLEKYPLPVEVYSQLNYPVRMPETPTSVDSLFQQIHTAPWNERVELASFFVMTKVETDICACTLSDKYDVVYYDAFAPDKQPDVWSQPIFDKLFAAMNPGGILTTYCAKGEVRRMLQRAGFDVERIPGPPGKRQMLRAGKR